MSVRIRSARGAPISVAPVFLKRETQNACWALDLDRRTFFRAKIEQRRRTSEVDCFVPPTKAGGKWKPPEVFHYPTAMNSPIGSAWTRDSATDVASFPREYVTVEFYMPGDRSGRQLSSATRRELIPGDRRANHAPGGP